MAINMQGAWTVTVKHIENFEPPQQFIITGATSGNGTYPASAAAGPVYVVGNHWVIRIQMKKGSSFVDSADKITFPTISAGQYQFDIQSNLPAEDPVWDDLILTCSTPVTQEDYLIYGNVSYYSGGCIFNPCHLPYLVIESPAALAAALKNPKLKVPIEKLYPERLQIVPPRPPGPDPDPLPFVPMVIPLREDTAMPAKIGQIFSAKPVSQSIKARDKSADTEAASYSMVGTYEVAKSRAGVLDFDRVEVANFVDHFYLLCETGPLPGIVLRFQEYDRTNAEMAGAPYSGMGNRENLGLCVTDKNGNYLFRFSRTLAQYFYEAAHDLPAGTDLLTQIMPDIIAQVLAYDPMHPAGYCYESAPYWNIPFLKQINICVPKDVAPMPTACQGGKAIQAIGDIFIGPPQPDGSRIGYNNFLGAEGRITAKSTLASTPQARCAAWAGTLDLFACFMDNPNVTQYTIRYRVQGATLWNFFQEYYAHPEIAKVCLPGYSGTKVGPFSRLLEIDGVANTPAQAYDNIESNSDFTLTYRNRKAWISSWLYPPVHNTLLGARQYGAVQFRIEGYTKTGAKVAAADDTITLYIDNTGPDYNIASVNMLGQAGGNCPLFNLLGNSNTPLTVKFRANQLEGFLGSYVLTVRKGNSGGFAIDNNGPGLILATYIHGDDLACNSLEGTFNDPAHDASGYVITDIVPHSGRWLDVDHPFCTFAVQLSCSKRYTNGKNGAVYGYGPIEYFLGMQANIKCTFTG
jgi:hypothetical protein